MEWLAIAVFVGSVVVGAGAFGICMGIPKLGDMLDNWIHRPKN